jgi:biopolymer transport protein ExbD
MKLSKRRAKDQSQDVAKPQLTSLIDVMTLLLVFLMQSFSAKATDIQMSSQIELARSLANKKAESMLTLEITPSRVYLLGESYAETQSIKEQNENLIAQLEGALTSWKKENPLQSKIMIECDKSVDFSVIKKVLFTSSKAGFKDYSLLVVEQKS